MSEKSIRCRSCLAARSLLSNSSTRLSSIRSGSLQAIPCSTTNSNGVLKYCSVRSASVSFTLLRMDFASSRLAGSTLSSFLEERRPKVTAGTFAACSFKSLQAARRSSCSLSASVSSPYIYGPSGSSHSFFTSTSFSRHPCRTRLTRSARYCP